MRAFTFIRFICVRCQDVFFSKGILAPQSEFASFDDSEYLSGVIRFCQVQIALFNSLGVKQALC